MSKWADPNLVKAIRAATRARVKARGRWLSPDADDDPAAEAEQLASAAIEHLELGRFDEARACAEACLELAEDHGEDEVWREVCLLVEEAAELGSSRTRF